MKTKKEFMQKSKIIEPNSEAHRRGSTLDAARDVVSPLDLSGGLRAHDMSDDELDEFCTMEIAALSQPRTKGAG